MGEKRWKAMMRLFSFELRRAQERGRSTFEGVLDNVRRVQWSEVKRGKLTRCNVQHQVHHWCLHQIKRGSLQIRMAII